MKIIEGMKQIKDLTQKSEDLRTRVAKYSVDLDNETPMYPDTAAQVKEWIQAHSDIQKEILKLRTSVQRTNLKTEVTIQLNGSPVTKTIAEWIHRRRDLAGREYEMWAGVGRRETSLREGVVVTSTGDKKEVKIRRHFDAKVRDEKLEAYRSEPNLIDANLEVINAVTDLIE